MSLGDERVRGQEGAFVSFASLPAQLEIHGGSALAEVGTRGSGTSISTSIGTSISVLVLAVLSLVVLILVILVVVLVALVLVALVLVALVLVALVVLVVLLLVLAGILVSLVGLASIASSRVVLGVGVSSIGITRVGISSTRTGISISSAIYSCKCGKALRGSQVGDREALCIEGLGQGLGRRGVLGVSTIHIGVDEGDDATQLLRGGKGGVGTQTGLVDSEGVEVLFSRNEPGRCIEDGSIVAKSRNNLVSQG